MFLSFSSLIQQLAIINIAIIVTTQHWNQSVLSIYLIQLWSCLWVKSTKKEKNEANVVLGILTSGQQLPIAIKGNVIVVLCLQDTSGDQLVFVLVHTCMCG